MHTSYVRVMVAERVETRRRGKDCLRRAVQIPLMDKEEPARVFNGAGGVATRKPRQLNVLYFGSPDQRSPRERGGRDREYHVISIADKASRHRILAARRNESPSQRGNAKML